LTIQSCAISGNIAGNGGDCTDDGCVAGHGGSGSGITNHGTLMIDDSTLNDNHTGDGGSCIGNSFFCDAGDGGDGSGIMNTGTLTIRNSTISSNTSGEGGSCNDDGYSSAGDGGSGAGIYHASGTSSIEHGTLTENTTGAKGICPGSSCTNGDDGEGGGLYQAVGTVQIKNTIVASNTSAAGSVSNDCWGTITSLAYNLVGAGTGCPSGGTGDQTTTDPKIGTLGANGGPTLTHPLLDGSSAIDAIPDEFNGCGVFYTSDQRGIPRPQSSSCDIGSFEREWIEPYKIYLPLIFK
jgi:hypothetical protein